MDDALTEGFVLPGFMTRQAFAKAIKRCERTVKRLEDAGKVVTVKKDIAGTNDDALYQDQRERTSGYRFDNLPAGTYLVDLAFAELRNGLTPGTRVFDVSVNGTVVLPGYDPAAAVGTLTADHRTFTVTVAAGGSIIVSLAERTGKQPPQALTASPGRWTPAGAGR